MPMLHLVPDTKISEHATLLLKGFWSRQMVRSFQQHRQRAGAEMSTEDAGSRKEEQIAWVSQARPY